MHQGLLALSHFALLHFTVEFVKPCVQINEKKFEKIMEFFWLQVLCQGLWENWKVHKGCPFGLWQSSIFALYSFLPQHKQPNFLASVTKMKVFKVMTLSFLMSNEFLWQQSCVLVVYLLWWPFLGPFWPFFLWWRRGDKSDKCRKMACLPIVCTL